jgi:adenylylsulfate reductase subunit A
MVQPRIVSIDTDVLIIGGGLAGCMAAIKACEHDGVRVTIIEKSNTVASGCAASGIDHVWAYIPPIHEPMGYTLDDMAEDHRQVVSFGFFRRDLFDLVAGTMYDRVLDLERFGIQFRYADSRVPGRFRIVPQFHSVPTSFNFDGEPLKPVLTKMATKRGAKILNRVQMTDYLTHDNQICGAVGVHTRTGEVYHFRAKAIVAATAPRWPCGPACRSSTSSSWGISLGSLPPGATTPTTATRETRSNRLPGSSTAPATSSCPERSSTIGPTWGR